mgnify:CR=1 FL=1
MKILRYRQGERVDVSEQKKDLKKEIKEAISNIRDGKLIEF